MATNTLPVSIVGKFVTSDTRSWGEFTDDNGKTVNAGSNLRIYVLDHSDNLREIKANNIPGIDRLTFGVEVRCDCEARPYKGNLTFTAVAVAPAKSAAAA